MSIPKALILGLLQGLTEFLPVSSSGHLVLAKSFLGVNPEGITFEVILHFATLLAIITVFWKRLSGMAVSLIESIYGLFSPEKVSSDAGRDRDIRWVGAVVLGTVPAAIVGIAFKDRVESMFSEPAFASSFLILTGIILLSTRFVRGEGRGLRSIDSVLVGLAQALAIVPGISRSGSTISAGLWAGVKREEAAEFSFILALPAIAGATLLEIGNLLSMEPSEIWPYVAGAAAAYISGYFAIRSLLRAVKGKRFDLFAYYCFGIGALGLFLSFLKT